MTLKFLDSYIRGSNTVFSFEDSEGTQYDIEDTSDYTEFEPEYEVWHHHVVEHITSLTPEQVKELT